MRKLLSLGLTVSVTSCALVALNSTATQAAPTGATFQQVAQTASPANAVAKKKPKKKQQFILNAIGYGTLVQGGKLPVKSDPTAVAGFGCTSKIGIDKTNHIADSKVFGLGLVDGVKTRTWTSRKGGTISSNSTHSIARIVLSQSILGTLSIEGLTTTSRAYHDAKGYHVENFSKIAEISLKPVAGPSIKLPIPTLKTPLTIPGLARIAFGRTENKVTKNSAKAYTSALDITVFPTNTAVRVAQSGAQIFAGVRAGIFSGNAAGLQARGLGDNVSVGRIPFVFMPCPGTNGVPQIRDTAGVDLPGLLSVDAIAAGQVGSQKGKTASGSERGQVAGVSLLDGRLKISGIVGQANVVRTGNKVTTSSTGTTVAEIIFDGEKFEIPPTGVLNILGLVKIESPVIKKIRNGIDVTALRVTILNDAGAVVEAGLARLQIRKPQANTFK